MQTAVLHTNRKLWNIKTSIRDGDIGNMRSGIFQATRLSRLSIRCYARRAPRTRVGQYIEDIGDESTQASQRTLKAVRTVGAFSIVTVICSLLWASSMSAPVKEERVEAGDLSTDIRTR